MLTHSVDVTGRGGFESSEPGIGQDGELPSSVGGAELPPYPAVLFQSGNRVREPASRRKGAVGQCAHTQSPVWHLGQPHQHLLVSVGHGAVTLEFLIEPVGEQLGRLNVRAPDRLLFGAEPSRLDPLGSLSRH